MSVFYDSDEEELQFLADYYREGLDNHELCVFVSELSPAEVKDQFKNHGLDIEPYLASGDFRLFDMLETYLPNGSFVADFMLTNVANFLEDATNKGYNGLRTAGEMNWIATQGKFQTEASHYEADVNSLASKIKFTGICLYATNKVSKSIINDALTTHPEFQYQDEQHANPFYFVPLAMSNNDTHDLQSRKRRAKQAIKQLLAAPELA